MKVVRNYAWWSDKENEVIQKNDGKMSILVTFGDNANVDNMIYKDRSLYRRILSESDDYIHYGMGYSAPSFVPIDLSDIKQFVVLSEIDCKHDYQAFDSKDECLQYLRQVERNGDYRYDIVVDLSKMSLIERPYDKLHIVTTRQL